MHAPRLLTGFCAVLLVVVAIVLATNDLNTRPAVVHAGPCGDLARLYPDWSDPGGPGQTPLLGLRVVKFAAIDHYNSWYHVITDPRVMPTDVEPPKPLVTAVLSEIEGDPNILVQLTPNARPQRNGSFATDVDIKFTGPVGVGIYRYSITMTCHGEPSTIPLTIYVNTCPTDESSAEFLQVQPVGAQPEGDTCGFTPTPTPLFTPAIRELDLVWGDAECISPANSGKDALEILLHLIKDQPSPTPQPGNCPDIGEKVFITSIGTSQWGDWDCSNEIGPEDSLAYLKWIALLQSLDLAPCPPVGVPLRVGSYWVLPD